MSLSQRALALAHRARDPRIVQLPRPPYSTEILRVAAIFDAAIEEGRQEERKRHKQSPEQPTEGSWQLKACVTCGDVRKVFDGDEEGLDKCSRCSE